MTYQVGICGKRAHNVIYIVERQASRPSSRAGTRGSPLTTVVFFK